MYVNQRTSMLDKIRQSSCNLNIHIYRTIIYRFRKSLVDFRSCKMTSEKSTLLQFSSEKFTRWETADGYYWMNLESSTFHMFYFIELIRSISNSDFMFCLDFINRLYKF